MVYIGLDHGAWHRGSLVCSDGYDDMEQDRSITSKFTVRRTAARDLHRSAAKII